VPEQTGGAPWSVAVASSLILGLIVGIPYYGIPFFYDYFEAAFGWSRAAMMLGLPVGTFVTLLAGPWLVPRVPPKRGIICGAAVCAAAMAGFGAMGGGLAGYYAVWLLYMAGWTFAGPLAHQILLSEIFGLRRGRAFAVSFFGISALTAALGFRGALLAMGGVMLLAVPVAIFGLPDLRVTTTAAGDGEPAFQWNRPFWLLLLGSTISIAGIGGVSQHLKLIFREAGFNEQARLDAVFGWTLMAMLTAGAAGRFLFAWGAERFPKRQVISVAFALMAGSMPLLLWLDRPYVPYVFGIAFGLGISSDSLMVPLLATDFYGGKSLGRVMGIIVPVNTVGQTWFPSLLSLLWAASGSYTIPLVVTFVCVLTGRLALALLPAPGARS
jgi:MFS family permease